jgi:hypothetical protein
MTRSEKASDAEDHLSIRSKRRPGVLLFIEI